MPIHFETAVAVLTFSVAVAMPSTGQAQETINVAIDFAEIVKLDRPVNTMIIGNPGILDASLSDSRTVVLTGKAAGTTNMIVLDESGERIATFILHVVPPDRQLTTVYYGSRQQTFSCAETCAPVLAVGDDSEHFQTTQAQIQARRASIDAAAATE